MSPRERGRMHAPGHRVDDGSHHTALLVQQADRAWTIHGLGAALRLDEDVMVEVCTAVLKHAQRRWHWYPRDPRDRSDAHLGAGCRACGIVQARCGAVVKPAAMFTSGKLPVVAAPHERACAQCQEQQGDTP